MQKNCCRSAAILVVLGLCVVARPAQSRENSWHVLVRGQDADLGETPIVVELKEPLPVGRYVMDTEGGGDATAAQVFEDRGGHYLSAILPCIGAHETVKFALKRPAQDNVPLAGGLSFETEGQNLKVKLGTDLLTEYHLGVGNKPFFFPLNRPHWRVLHPNLPDGDPARRGSRPSAPTVVLVYPWQCQRRRLLVGRQAIRDHQGDGTIRWSSLVLSSHAWSRITNGALPMSRKSVRTSGRLRFIARSPARIIDFISESSRPTGR